MVKRNEIYFYQEKMGKKETEGGKMYKTHLIFSNFVFTERLYCYSTHIFQNEKINLILY